MYLLSLLRTNLSAKHHAHKKHEKEKHARSRSPSPNPSALKEEDSLALPTDPWSALSSPSAVSSTGNSPTCSPPLPQTEAPKPPATDIRTSSFACLLMNFSLC